MESFGETIKRLRKKKYGLREFAKQVGISATYLSKMERGKDPPPAEDKIAKMAQLLGADQNKLFALAKKLPPEFKQAFIKNPTYTRRVPEFLRTATEKNLTNKEWKKLIERIKKK